MRPRHENKLIAHQNREKILKIFHNFYSVSSVLSSFLVSRIFMSDAHSPLKTKHMTRLLLWPYFMSSSNHVLVNHENSILKYPLNTTVN